MNKLFISTIYTALALVAIFAFQPLAIDSSVQAWTDGSGGSGGCCGGGGGGGGYTPQPPTPPRDPSPVYPQCVISAAPASITAGGQSTLTWTTTRAQSASINQSIGAVAIGTNLTRVVSPANTITYTMTVHSSTGHTATCATTVTVTPVVVPAPDCTLSANPTSITVGGQSTLTWTSQNAVSAVLSAGIGSVSLSGNRGVNPTATTEYVLTVKNSANVEKVCKATVTVTAVPVPSCDFINASPVTITRGQSSTLSWGTTNVTSASIDNGVGSVAVDGSATVTPNDTTTYTLTAVGANNQQVTCAKTVTVTPVVVNAPVCDYFTASPVTITRGQSTTLTWGTTNASSAFINNGVGNVDVDGSRTVSPLETTTYTLTATGAENKTVSCTKTIVVDQPEVKTPRCEYFNASATSINRGNSVTLSWDTTNANSVVINPGVGTVAVDGSTTVSPSDTTTYTLTITGANNQTASCTRTVTVETGGGGGGGGSSSPKCTLKISDNKITRGQRVTLKWDTSRATEVTIKDNHGKTLVSTDDVKSSEKKDLYDGEIELRPEKDTTYTLLAERGSKDRTCKVSVDVSGGVTVTEIRDQKPVVTGIALTQVPYTGFEAGPFLTMIFYGLLLLWALYLAYVLVVRRQSIGTVAVATPAPVAPIFTPAAIAPVTNTPRFVASAVAEPVAVATPVIGYATPVAHDAAYEATALAIEEAAHREHILFSSEAMRLVIDTTTEATRATTVAAVIGKAKASYPTEDGWVVITIDRMKSLLASVA